MTVQRGPYFHHGSVLNKRSKSPSRIHLAIERSPGNRLEILPVGADCKEEFFGIGDTVLSIWTVRWRAVPCPAKIEFQFLYWGSAMLSASTELRVLRQGPAPDSTEAMICSFECTFCRGCAIECFRCVPQLRGELVRRPIRPQGKPPGIQRPANGLLKPGGCRHVGLAFDNTNGRRPGKQLLSSAASVRILCFSLNILVTQV